MPEPEAISPLDDFQRRLEAAREENARPVPPAPRDESVPLMGTGGVNVDGNLISAEGAGRRGSEESQLEGMDFCAIINGYPAVVGLAVTSSPRAL